MYASPSIPTPAAYRPVAADTISRHVGGETIPVNPEGTVALVTGGASGLGRATAEALQARGATVVVLDLERSLEALGDDTGLHRAPADVRDPDGVAAVVALARSLGPLRILVNCAGIGDAGLVARGGEAMELERFQRVIDINLVGTFNVVRLAAVAMQKNEPVDGERGVIVNTASIAAFDGQMGQTAYAASKGGIVGLTLPLARDLARSLIRCVTIAPGTFDTPLLAALPEEARASLALAVPHPSRLGEPSEYAALAVHIVENQMLNGEVIRLDGALRMAPR
jgi:NAD(P)-dependent dehydrogenase (short-subunit alcohol dehydrogenase family)